MLKRDPRMVERKKTGRAKARKGVRPLSSLRNSLTHPGYSLVHLGQALDGDLWDTLGGVLWNSTQSMSIIIIYIAYTHSTCALCGVEQCRLLYSD